MLPHAIYYDTLGSITDESSDEWKTTVAGLLVLRLVDDWVDFGPQITATDITGLQAVREAIAQIPIANPVRSLLGKLLRGVEEAEQVSIPLIAPQVFAYAQALQYAGHSALEQEVLATLRVYAVAKDDIETSIRASHRLGVLAREFGDLNLAQEYHSEAEQNARAIGDIDSALFAQLAQVTNVAARGNIPAAIAICTSIAGEAKAEGRNRLYGQALHQRAHVAILQKDFQEAVRLTYQALEYAETESYKDRVMIDLAAGFTGLGRFSAARDTYLIIAATSQDPAIRNIVSMNLMDIAIRERQEEAFLLYRATLELATLSPYHTVNLRWTSAQGLRTFGDFAGAEVEFRRAHAIAEQYGLQQFVFELEQEMNQPEPSPSKEWSSDVDSIAIAIEEKLKFQNYTASLA